MTDFANYLETALLDHVLGGTTYTQPSNVYALLHTADPGEDCSTAVAGENAKSAAITWAAASAGSKATSADITWSSVSTTETISHVSIWDSATAGAVGNPLFYGDLTSPVSLTAGDDFTIPSGSLTVALD